jgi:hypothetical protein
MTQLYRRDKEGRWLTVLPHGGGASRRGVPHGWRHPDSCVASPKCASPVHDGAKAKLLSSDPEGVRGSGQAPQTARSCARRGLYTSLIPDWRRQRDRGALEALAK